MIWGLERIAVATAKFSLIADILQSLRKKVGARGFEPPTPWSQTMCATRLRHAPSDC